ncbi:hypothetical protein N7478_009193 [Penicillium angulare]|uniref:uncharacterized protein n=1 Tax=Penicillium angulare TaxID=116970 RepID=UPI00253FDD36|nr:uncharacterized protein N7478_009193 [Penicillium angulare]KAJ5274068.1 hypothetical protein N7478_009193 [Penicillium angulare]
MNAGPIGMIAKGVGSGIGFVSETHKYRKAKKAAQQERELERQSQPGLFEERDSPSHVPPSSSPFNTFSPYGSKEDEERYNFTPTNVAERSWQLDEAQDHVIVETKKPRKSKSGVANPDKLIAAFLQRQPPPYCPAPVQLDYVRPIPKLHHPVAIPQRRPKDKARGFIHAYAPDLQNVGIDQETWFDFVETFNEACLANPWINAINLAALAASPLPSLASQAISMALMVATTVAMEVQGRHRQNKALDKLNEEFFRPRGLFCLVMTWDAESTSTRTNMNVTDTIRNTMNAQGRKSHKFQYSNGVTNGMESIQTAELVFPGLDLLATMGKNEQAGFKNKMKRGKLFVEDYMDRKAQAKFYSENPGSHLNQAGKPKFHSKYGDPTHGIHSGFAGSTTGQNGRQRGGLVEDQSSGMGGRGDSQSGGLLGIGGQGGGMGGRGDGQRGGTTGIANTGPIGGIIALVGMAVNHMSERNKSQDSSNSTVSAFKGNGAKDIERSTSNVKQDSISNPDGPINNIHNHYVNHNHNPVDAYCPINTNNRTISSNSPYQYSRHPIFEINAEYGENRHERQAADAGWSNEHAMQHPQYQQTAAGGSGWQPPSHQSTGPQHQQLPQYQQAYQYHEPQYPQTQYQVPAQYQLPQYQQPVLQNAQYSSFGGQQQYMHIQPINEEQSRNAQNAPMPGQQQQNQQGGLGGGSGGISLGKLFSSKVLYLMVVNMPTDEEMAEAQRLSANWKLQGQQQEL